MKSSLKRGLAAAAIIAAIATSLTSCDSNDKGSSASSTISGVATPSTESSAGPAEANKSASAEASAEARQQAKADADAKKAADAVARDAEKQPTVNGRLETVMTAFCGLSMDSSQSQMAEGFFFEKLWLKYWRPGKWDRNIVVATRQRRERALSSTPSSPPTPTILADRRPPGCDF